MSKAEMLRALVNERLAAAAEDIFMLFNRTIVEYEEELNLYKEKNQRKVNLRIQLVRGDDINQIPFVNPGPGLNQEITETAQIKEELEEQSSVKQEEEQLQVCVPESSAVCLKTEESSLLRQRQSEHREETLREDISSETHFHSETGHTEHWDWEPSSCLQMETEADGDHNNQVQSRDIELSSLNTSAPQSTDYNQHNQHMSESGRTMHVCPLCPKKFTSNRYLRRHYLHHTREKRFYCGSCEKAFTYKSNLDQHRKTHTGEKPFCCSLCNKCFSQKSNLDKHSRLHSGEKPYSCSFCMKAFSDKSNLRSHMKVHTGQSSTELHI